MVRNASTVTLGVWDQPVLVWLWDPSTAPPTSSHAPSPPDKSTSCSSLARTATLSLLPGGGEGVMEKTCGQSRGDKGEEADGPGWDWGRAGAHTNAQGCPQDPRGMAQGPGGSWVFCPGPGHFHTGRAAPAALLQLLFPVFNLTFPH